MFQAFDLFGHDVSFRENGRDQLKTYFGALISVAILTLVLIYGVNQYKLLVTKGDTNYSLDLEEFNFRGDEAVVLSP